MSLDAAHQAFEAGNFAEARRLAKELLQQTSAGDEAARAAAAEILRRTGIDPLVVWMTVGSALFYAVIVFFGLR
jgi:hypothetical protein